MPHNKLPRTPSLRHHKATGQGFVELNGRRMYLGVYGRRETQERYHQLIAEWIANGRELPIAPDQITVVEMVARFWKHALRYYRRPDGAPSDEIGNFRIALRPLVSLYGNTEAGRFGPKALKAVRQRMIDSGNSRGYINKNVQRTKSLFKWAVAEELIPPSVYQSLQAVPGLKRGRSEARETAAIKPVPEAHIDVVHPYASRQVWAMVQLQLLTGARAGELVGLRPIDLDTGGAVWSCTPPAHKTAHHGHRRVILFGPRAQRVLQPFLAGRAVTDYLISPQEAEAERYAKATIHRRPDQKPNPRRTDRTLGDCYTVCSYRRAIHRACEDAGVPRWSPHRLRHNTASRLRRDYGIDTAQTILGHRLGSAVTEIYCEANLARAVEIIAKTG
ncbi:MAG: site-specific integrase [Phycisphaerae bacterium]